jgi:xylose isomerase
MKNVKHQFATRLNSFRKSAGSGIPVREAIQAVARVPGITAVELNYPQHFAGDDAATSFAAAADAGLKVTALNLRFDGPDFDAGAFTHPVAANREAAVRVALEAVDLAAAHAIPHVVLWMGPDGFDYPFQVDYGALWSLEVTGFRRVAQRNATVRVSVEYKASDPRRVSLVRSMSDSLLAAAEVAAPNFGVTLDFCHALMAGEHPAAAAAMALARGKLFGVHLNDGYGVADDGLLVGSVHPWHALELLWVLRRGGYAGTIYFDTFPDRVDPASECAANIRTVERMERLLDRLSPAELKKMQDGQDAMAATRLLHDLLLGASYG